MKISEKTLLTALVNIKCVGYPGKCLRPFNKRERGQIIDELFKRGYIDEHARPTAAAQNIITANIHLCQY